MSVLTYRQIYNIDDARYETVVELSDNVAEDATFLHQATPVTAKQKAAIKKAGVKRGKDLKLAENKERLAHHYANHHCENGHNGHQCYMAKALITQINALQG